VAVISAFGQPMNTNLMASSSGNDRIAVVKASIPLTDWHEKSFWKQYESYWDEIQKVSRSTYAGLQAIAGMNKQTDSLEAFEAGCSLIDGRFNELSIRYQYFTKIGMEHNGVIGLQFIQTEAMLDIVECSRLYEETPMQKFRFLPKKFPTTQVKKAKHSIIINALSLTPEEAAQFLPVYLRYEQEVEQILGEEYNLYELYVGEASDFTPMLARRQGYDLLTVMERELKLKEKYFVELNGIIGAPIAARFLAWEDYYSIICKMNAWVEAR
jgi:hypothetical protein